MYELKDREMIFVFTGPDGSGRKTIADMAGSTLGIKKVISYSTRERRPGEVHGQDYHFISREQFLEAEQNRELLESVRIHRNMYGVKNQDVERLFQSSGCIYLIVNPQGADILKSLYGDKLIRLFIYANRETVMNRQREKGLSSESIQRNLSCFEEDMAYLSKCEHAFENYELAHTVFDVTNTLEGYLKRNLLEKD